MESLARVSATKTLARRDVVPPSSPLRVAHIYTSGSTDANTLRPPKAASRTRIHVRSKLTRARPDPITITEG